MDLPSLPGPRPEFNLESLPGSLNTTYTSTNPAPFSGLGRIHTAPDFSAPLPDLLNMGLGILMLKSPYLNEIGIDVTGQTIIPGTMVRENVRLFQVITPGIYHIGLRGMSKLNDRDTPNVPLEEAVRTKLNSADEARERGESNNVPPKEFMGTNSDPDGEIQEHGKSEDWWKESRWMKVRAIQEAHTKPPLDYRDLRKNWRRFAALTAKDRSLRFNTPRLRSLRRSVFGERMGVRGMKHRRDTGIDYGKKEKMVLPLIDTRSLRKKNQPPPVFRGVPKVFYDWSRNPTPIKWGKTLDAPKEFYDWSTWMEEEKQTKALAELTDFQRFVARSTQRAPRSDFESFLRSKGAEFFENRDIGQYKYKDLERDIDPDVSGFGGYDEMSTSSSDDELEDEDEDSSSSLNESEDEYENDCLVALAWEGQEI